MASTITLNYQGQLRCAATRDKTGQVVQTDVSAEHGGLDEYFSPVELVSAALASCVSGVVAIVAKRNGVDLTAMQTHVSLEMVASPVRRIGSIRLTLQVPGGSGISAVVRKKLEAAANACPVKNSLSPDVRVAVEFVYEAREAIGSATPNTNPGAQQ
jgi:putative redox protein